MNRKVAKNNFTVAPRIGQTITIQNVGADTDTVIEGIFSASGDSALRFFFYPYGTCAVSLTDQDTCSILHPMICDLTQMFGSTIADYAYTLEQGHAGDGIAWLKSFGFFTADYYPYDAGSLLSVKTSGHVVTGKNLLDDLERVKASNNITFGGAIDPNNGTSCVLPAGTYTFSVVTADGTSSNLYAKDVATNTNLTGFPAYSVTQKTFTLTEQTALRVWVYKQSYTSTDAIKTAQIEIGSTATPYEPYTAQTYPLSDIELRGILKLDASNNLYYDGDTYASDGTVTRKYGIVDLGTLSWTRYTSGGVAYFMTESLAGSIYARVVNEMPNIICPRYVAINQQYASQLQNKTTFCLANGNVYIRDDTYSDAPSFKTAMSGVYLVYELATPTTETTDPFTNPQQAGTTEEYIDTRTVPMPVGHVTEYFNMVQMEKIQMHMGQAQAIKMHMPKGD